MKPCRLTMGWPAGEGSPRPGEWLKTPNGRTAYEITAAREVKRRRPALGGRKLLVLTCARHAIADIPDGATVIDFVWNPRNRHNFRRRTA